MSSAKTLLIAVASFAAAAHLTTGVPASQTVTRTAKTPARLPMHFGLRNAAEEQFVRSRPAFVQPTRSSTHREGERSEQDHLRWIPEGGRCS